MGVGAIGQAVHLQTGTFKVDKTSSTNVFGTTSVKFDIKTGNNMTRRTGFKAGTFRKFKAIAHCASSTKEAQRIIRHGELKLSKGVNNMVSEMANKSANNQTQLSGFEIFDHLKDVAKGGEHFMRAGGNNNINAVETRVQANLETSLEALRRADPNTFDEVLTVLRTEMAQVDALIGMPGPVRDRPQLQAISRAMHTTLTNLDRKYNVDVFVNNPAHNNTYNDFTGAAGLAQLNAVFDDHLVRLPNHGLRADIRAHYQAMGIPATAQDVQNMVTAFKADVDYAETAGYTPWQNVDYLYTDPTSDFSTQAVASNLLTHGQENFDWLHDFKVIEENQDTMSVTDMRDQIGDLLELCKEEDWAAAWANADAASDVQHVNIGQEAKINFLKGMADITGVDYDESYDLDQAIADLNNMQRNELKEVLSALKTPRAGLNLTDATPYNDLHANATQILGVFKSTLG
ncbi:MAG: hypothetical protein AAFS07_18010 [Pseudomonadota bacterium]